MLQRELYDWRRGRAHGAAGSCDGVLLPPFFFPHLFLLMALAKQTGVHCGALKLEMQGFLFSLGYSMAIH